jgi:hypothetical protein
MEIAFTSAEWLGLGTVAAKRGLQTAWGAEFLPWLKPLDLKQLMSPLKRRPPKTQVATQSPESPMAQALRAIRGEEWSRL